MKYTHDPEADAIYIYIANEPAAPITQTEPLGDARLVDYDINHEVVGVELLSVSSGVDTHDLPRRDEIERLLIEHDIRIFE